MSSKYAPPGHRLLEARRVFCGEIDIYFLSSYNFS